MARKLLLILTVPCIAVTLALAGLLAAAALSGKLTGQNLRLIAKVLRGEPLAPPETEARTAAPAQPAASASDQNARHAEAAELHNLLLARREQELADQARQLENLRREIETERQNLRQARLKLQEEILAARRRTEDDDFKRTLKLFESMQPQQVRDLLMEMDEPLAAAYLQAMNVRAARKVSEEFQTPEQRRRLQRLLDLTGGQDGVTYAGRD